MSISQALSTANSGLGAASRQASIAGQNIANALTPGYSRRDVSLAERALAGEGAGVRVAGIARAQAPAITFERRGADADAARDGARADAASAIARLLGGPEDAGALFGKYAAFDRALRALANTPDSAPAQNAAIGAAATLVAGVNSLAQSYQTMRMTADRDIADKVDAVNAALKQIENLNSDIASATVAGRDASALLDQRDRFLDQINEAIPVRALTRENGRIDLMTIEGVMLLAGTARTVSFTPSPVIAAGMTLANGALSGLSADGVAISPKSGAVAGLLAVRDDIAPAAAAELDALAEDLIARFSAAGVDPTLAPGAPGLFTDAGGALAPPVAAGLAGRLSLNAAADPAQGGAAWRLRDGLGAAAPGAIGSNTLLRGLLAQLDQPRANAISNGRALTALEAAADLSASAGARSASFDAALQSSEAYAGVLRDAELSVTGVDTDAELQNLLIIEQSYAANARLIEAVQAMIDRLLEI